MSGKLKRRWFNVTLAALTLMVEVALLRHQYRLEQG